MEFCFATPADSRALLDIYRQYIDTAVTFQYELPSEMEFARRIEEIQLTYPFLVCRSGDVILGYAYAHPVRPYVAYQWGAELTIYLRYDSEGDWEESGQLSISGTGTVSIPIRPRRCDHMQLRLAGEGECRIYALTRVLETGSDM